VACEIDTPEKDGYLNPIRGKAYDHFIKKGILLRPLGNTLYILPPYCIKPSELATIYLEIEEFANQIN
jgi:adenosylmethionine-8-amino-7-oxononanoate aminotransferase